MFGLVITAHKTEAILACSGESLLLLEETVVRIDRTGHDSVYCVRKMMWIEPLRMQRKNRARQD